MAIYVSALLICVVVIGVGSAVSSALSRLAATHAGILERLEVLVERAEVGNEELKEIRERLDSIDEPPYQSPNDTAWEREHEGGSLYAIRGRLREIHRALQPSESSSKIILPKS